MVIFKEQEISSEVRDWDGCTPLLLAAFFGHSDVCAILLKAGAKANALDNFGRNALHLAALRGKTEVVRLFISNKELRDATDEKGNTPLDWATQMGHMAVIKLLSAPSSPPENPDLSFLEPQIEGLEDEFPQQIEDFDDVNHHPLGDDGALSRALEGNDLKNGRNALHMAASEGETVLVRLLAVKGKLLEARDDYGFTPLLLAAGRGHRDTCKILLDAGANPKAKYESYENALFLAIYSSKIKVVELLALNQELLEIRDKRGSTPLLVALIYGQIEIGKVLLKAGANAKATNNFGENALHLAACIGETELVRLLMANQELLDAKE